MSVNFGEYRLKRINFMGKETRIICQNENGPCPLLSIVNVMLLRGRMEIPQDHGSIITNSHLLQMVAELLLSLPLSEDPSLSVQQQHQLQATIELLPRLQTGLDVNIAFSTTSSFEYTGEMEVFDLLGVTLLHGWLVDPNHDAAASVIGSRTYNQIVELLVYLRERDEGEQKGDEGEQKDDGEHKACNTISAHEVAPGTACLNIQLDPTHVYMPCLQGAVIAEFLESSANQLTQHGLIQLHESVNEGQLCVLYRNSHFSTLHKHEGRLYVLVTDLGYSREFDVVWESLDSVDGDSEFRDSSFCAVNRDGSQTDDMRLAQHIQELEEKEMLQQHIQAEAAQAAQGAAQGMSDEELARMLMEQDQAQANDEQFALDLQRREHLELQRQEEELLRDQGAAGNRTPPVAGGRPQQRQSARAKEGGCSIC
ncbi:unnamed protein product [Chrysoparadoxa australica]